MFHLKATPLYNPSNMPSLETRLRSLSPYSRRAEHSRRDDRSLSRSRSPRRRRYSRSPSPPSQHQRSRSPRRDHKESKRKNTAGGFRWKEKPRNEEEDRRDDGRLERGYREQDKPRARSATRDGGKRDDIELKFGPQKVDSRGSRKGNEVEDKFGGEKPKKEKEKKVKSAVAPVGQEMIIVNVNDRLGTKASIPCLASDPISMCT